MTELAQEAIKVNPTPVVASCPAEDKEVAPADDPKDEREDEDNVRKNDSLTMAHSDDNTPMRLDTVIDISNSGLSVAEEKKEEEEPAVANEGGAHPANEPEVTSEPAQENPEEEPKCEEVDYVLSIRSNASSASKNEVDKYAVEKEASKPCTATPTSPTVAAVLSSEINQRVENNSSPIQAEEDCEKSSVQATFTEDSDKPEGDAAITTRFTASVDSEQPTGEPMVTSSPTSMSEASETVTATAGESIVPKIDSKVESKDEGIVEPSTETDPVAHAKGIFSCGRTLCGGLFDAYEETLNKGPSDEKSAPKPEEKTAEPSAPKPEEKTAAPKTDEILDDSASPGSEKVQVSENKEPKEESPEVETPKEDSPEREEPPKEEAPSSPPKQEAAEEKEKSADDDKVEENTPEKMLEKDSTSVGEKPSDSPKEEASDDKAEENAAKEKMVEKPVEKDGATIDEKSQDHATELQGKAADKEAMDVVSESEAPEKVAAEKDMVSSEAAASVLTPTPVETVRPTVNVDDDDGILVQSLSPVARRLQETAPSFEVQTGMSCGAVFSCGLLSGDKPMKHIPMTFSQDLIVEAREEAEREVGARVPALEPTAEETPEESKPDTSDKDAANKSEDDRKVKESAEEETKPTTNEEEVLENEKKEDEAASEGEKDQQQQTENHEDKKPEVSLKEDVTEEKTAEQPKEEDPEDHNDEKKEPEQVSVTPEAATQSPLTPVEGEAQTVQRPLPKDPASPLPAPVEGATEAEINFEQAANQAQKDAYARCGPDACTIL